MYRGVQMSADILTAELSRNLQAVYKALGGLRTEGNGKTETLSHQQVTDYLL